MASETSSGGQPGNQNRAKQYRIKHTLEALMEEASSKREGLTKLQSACKALLERAEEGDTAAFREAADRVDGKPSQAIDLGSDPDRPMVQKVVRELVRPNNPDG